MSPARTPPGEQPQLLHCPRLVSSMLLNLTQQAFHTGAYIVTCETLSTVQSKKKKNEILFHKLKMSGEQKRIYEIVSETVLVFDFC